VYRSESTARSEAAAPPPTTSTCWVCTGGWQAVGSASSASSMRKRAFQLVRIVPTPANVCVIEGRPGPDPRAIGCVATRVRPVRARPGQPSTVRNWVTTATRD
jgi:hypothetical protein